MTEIWTLDATDVANGIRSGSFTSREAVESCLSRLGGVNPRLNAVVDVLTDDALAAADAADAARLAGNDLPPLHGVPVTLKINVDWTGRPTDNGVVALKDNIAPGDSSAPRAWRRAGAVVIGRTNAPAYSMRAFTGNELHGNTLNPWDRRITSGGSSGGASSAVASGIGPLAHGNDIGGSVRYPAYCTGIFGIRPTAGRVGSYNPSGADRFVGAQLMSVQGVLARSVRDLRLGLDAMAAFDERDVWQVPVAPLTGVQRGPKRVALWRSGFPFALHPNVSDALQRAAGWLSEAGYEVEEAAPVTGLEAFDLWSDIILTESRYGLGPMIDLNGDAAIKEFFGAMIARATPLDLGGYLKAQARRTSILREWTLFLERFPILLMPISTLPPMPADHDLGEGGIERVWEPLSPVVATAALGLPGVSAPTGVVDGLPTGVQLVTARFREAAALAAAEVIGARAPEVVPVDPTWT